MFRFFNRKKNKNQQVECLPKTIDDSIENKQPCIRFETTVITSIKETRLVPIKDKRLVARVSENSPNFLQVTKTIGDIKEVKDKISNIGELYRAVIPKGAKLMDSKSLEGAKRGGFLDSNNQLGQANWVQVNGDIDKALQNISSQQISSTVFNVASMIVGPYYMTEINEELDKISNNISKIASFQKNEYLSRVTAIINRK